MIKKICTILAVLALAAASLHAQRPRFAWGAAVASSVDLSSNNMSAIGINAYFGMQAPMVQMLGIGAGIDVPVNNSFYSMPVFLVARSNFCNHSTLCFADVRAGVSINDIPFGKKQTGAYISPGVGFNLASSSKFNSHLILAYTYLGRKDFEHAGEMQHLENVHLATVRIGISF